MFFIYSNLHQIIFRSWWVLLLLLTGCLLVMFLNLSPANHMPSPAIQPSSFFLMDTKINGLPNKMIKKTNSNSKNRPSCSSEVKKVGFMKTHKTASSTVQNILFRYGMNSGWNFVLPAHGSHLGPPRNQYKLTIPFNHAWIDDVPWKPMIQDQGYNIFALHTKWNQEEVSNLMGEGTKFITVLRDPVDNFESLYNYVHFNNTFKMNLEDFVHSYIEKKRPIHRVNGYLGRNQQLWDLGIARKDLTNLEAVKEKIEEINQHFDLVMIAEDFDASLVFLSDELCWPLFNMTSLKVNARKKSAVEKLSQKTRDILQDWLWADQMLYDHFKEKHDRRKEEYGLYRLESQINKLNEYNANIKTECVLQTVRKNTNILDEEYVPWSKDVVAFKINEDKNPYCKFYGISELHFIDYIRDMQVSRSSAVKYGR